jgi:hypothetical protein
MLGAVYSQTAVNQCETEKLLYGTKRTFGLLPASDNVRNTKIYILNFH